MTTKGRTRKSAQRRGASPSVGQPSGTAAAGDATEPAARVAAATAPDDVQQLRQQIAQIRGQLGETVEQLAAKADVKSAARAKAAELSGRVKNKASRAAKEAAGRAGSVPGQLAGKSAPARQKAVPVARSGRDQLQHRAAAVGTPVWEATPEPLRQAVTKGASTVKQRRVPLAVATGVLIAGYLVLSRRARR
jgi:ABC-type transporter Mla subunit MlaD